MRQRVASAAEVAISILAWILFAVVLSGLLTRDVYVPADTAGQVRLHVREIEFDFVGWTLAAAGVKLRQASVDEQAFLDEPGRAQVVRRYFGLRAQLEDLERRIASLYGDPAISDPEAATAAIRQEAGRVRAQLAEVQPLAEAILQEQLAVILAEQGLAVGGQPVPPVSFHLTPLPYALIVSPRDTIRVDANIDVNGELTLDQIVALEEEIAAERNVSTLVVPLGGIGTYPTMVAHSSDLNWIASVVAHEWLHNYLTLRPLGLAYSNSPDTRTMNETTAEMIGDELGALLIERYYPDLARPPRPFDNFLRRGQSPEAADAARPAFDFRAAMHETRVTADRLLAQGRIETAEAYMEARRRFLWRHGYQIRKLNQAYFAFYGAYSAGGGGASGADPVTEAVHLLRRRSSSIAAFVNTIAWFSSYEELRQHLGLPE